MNGLPIGKNKLVEAVKAVIELRPYQQDVESQIHERWHSGHRNVLAVLPTGAGKTVLFSKIVHDTVGGACVIAHRQELVLQISMALAANSVRHRIIAPRNVIKMIVKQQMKKFGRSFYDPNSPKGVAGVDTLVNRADKLRSWLMTVKLWVQDEAHHVLVKNKWGKVCDLFPNANGLGVTATPERADGKGLGRHADGVFDIMVVGPTMRDLINMGFLTEYRVICPKSDYTRPDSKSVGSSGDFTQKAASDSVANSSLVMTDGKSRVVGDVVENYLKFASGKLGVTFAPDVKTAQRIADQFNAAGVPSKVVSAKNTASEREEILDEFRNRKLLNLVNVDLFGEGFDLPAIEVVSMARPTKSYSLYVQQFGRALRLMDGKERAIIIDHVGNISEHKLPDVPREWSLDSRSKRSSSPSDAIPLRTCQNEYCFTPFERTLSHCPECGWEVPAPALRSSVEHVDGDLYELDPATLEEMRRAASVYTRDRDEVLNEYRRDMIGRHAPYPEKLVRQYARKLNESADSQKTLTDIMAWWAGYLRSSGKTDSEIFKTFYFKFGIDWLNAQALESKDADKLSERVSLDMGNLV